MRLFFNILLPIFFIACSAKNHPSKGSQFLKVNLSVDSSSSESFEKISSYFRNRGKANSFNGVVLFAEKGKIVYRETFGFANFKNKTPLQTDSQFQLASVSKTFTATAISILKQSGKLSYSDDIRKFIPKFPYEGITISMLLSHRSGLSNYMYFCDKLLPKEKKEKGINNKDVIELIIRSKPKQNYPPDKKYYYSNTNYLLLASVIEIVSGKSYEQFLKDEIFDKTGMKNTLVYNKNSSPEFPSEVIGYKNLKYEAENSYLNGIVGDKGIYSTVDDMFIFDQALRQGILIDKNEMGSIYTPRHPEIKVKDNYGYGWRIHIKENGGKIVYHGGWWKGFRSYFIRDLDSDKTIVLLKNINLGGRIRLQELLKLFDIENEEDENIINELDSLSAN
ncbi:MAG: serine hydrolase [Ignavibacteriales bacterium CG_4_9_14_3_um_filter_34_10]|nr:MAG: serine hydrolase [Ignavibacteriales bacterium CG_4_9_14_3_um_filter_34_10]